MPLDNPQGGIGYAPEFQSSALPWITSSLAPTAGSPVGYSFPFVTRFVTLVNQSTGAISFGVTQRGVSTSSNKVIVPANQYLTLEWRVANIFVQSEGASGGSYSLAIGLTTIPVRNMPPLTGTLGDGTSGWPGVG